MESFKLEAEARGYDVTFINRNVAGKPGSYLKHCRYRGLDGIIVACVDFNGPEIRELVDSGIPMVTIDHVFDDRMAVLSDNTEGLEALVRYIYSRGHRKIAFLHGEDIMVTQRRLKGFHRACRELGLEIPEEYIRGCVYHDPARCAEATRELLALPDRPTCIIFPDDFSYIGGLNVLKEQGLRVPEDISAAEGQFAVMKLTTYSQNTAEIGKAAADRLIRLIENPGTTPIERVLVPGGFVEGDTVKQI